MESDVKDAFVTATKSATKASEKEDDSVNNHTRGEILCA